MTKENRLWDYLGHMRKAIERIERYTSHMDEAEFLSNELVQDAVIRNIEIIGEASNNIQRANAVFAAENAEIPWQVLYKMRNRISHGYDKVDLSLVWKTIQSDLPYLYMQINRLCAGSPRPNF